MAAIVRQGDVEIIGDFITGDANIYPGRLVKRGTDDNHVVINDGTAYIGWAGYEQTAPNYRKSDPDTAYDSGDVIAVIKGVFKIRAHLAAGNNVTAGAPLKPTSNGELAAVTASTDVIVAIAAESVDASSGAKDIYVWATGR